MADKVSRTPSPIISPMHDPRQKKAVVQPPHNVLGAVNRKYRAYALRGMVPGSSDFVILWRSANPVIPGQNTTPAGEQVYQQGLGQKALLAKRFAKAK